MNIVQFKKTIMYNAMTKMPIFVVGGPGGGKTESIDQAAKELTQLSGFNPDGTAKHPWEFFPLVASNFDPWDLVGFNVPTRRPDNTLGAELTTPFFWEKIAGWDGVNKSGILLLDEASDCEMPTQKVLARMVNSREVGTRRLPDGCYIVLAGNRRKDKSGVQRMASMFQNRFCQIELDFNADLLIAHLRGIGFHEAGLAFIKTSSQYVYSEDVPVDPGPFVSPRSFHKGVDALTHLGKIAGLPEQTLPGAGVDEIDVIAKAMMAGWVGDAAAAQFFVHLKYQHELPTMEQIVLDPGKAKMPKNMGGQYMVSFMVGGRTQNAQLQPVFSYLKRLPIEFQVVAMKQLTNRHNKQELPNLFTTQGVNDWLVANRATMMAAL